MKTTNPAHAEGLAREGFSVVEVYDDRDGNGWHDSNGSTTLGVFARRPVGGPWMLYSRFQNEAVTVRGRDKRRGSVAYSRRFTKFAEFCDYGTSPHDLVAMLDAQKGRVEYVDNSEPEVEALEITQPELPDERFELIGVGDLQLSMPPLRGWILDTQTGVTHKLTVHRILYRFHCPCERSVPLLEHAQLSPVLDNLAEHGVTTVSIGGLVEYARRFPRAEGHQHAERTR